MKKLTMMILAALTALMMCTAALANDAAAGLYDTVTELLFSTGNVTLKVNAELSLDSEWFKTVEGTWMQDGDRSLRQLILRSPRKDGTERKNGYTIVMDGSNVQLMEEYTPGVYRWGTAAERTSLLRCTVETRQLISLGRMLASQADLLLGGGAITTDEDGTIRVTLGADAPAAVNALLNEAARFAAKRYFGMDYDTIREDSGISMSSFSTVTQGILYSLHSLALRQAEVTLKTDGNGALQQAEGRISLDLETAWDGTRGLDILFTAEVSDRGSTMVRKFNPKDYDVVLAPGAEEPPADGDGESAPRNDEALRDRMCNEAMRIWENTGFNMLDTTSVSCEPQEYRYEVTIRGADGTDMKAHFTFEGEMTDIEAEPNAWDVQEEDKYDFDPEQGTEQDVKAREYMKTFLENIRYERLEEIRDFTLHWTCTNDGAVYGMYEGDPQAEDGKGVTFVVRLSPEMRIESYSCVSNG